MKSIYKMANDQAIWIHNRHFPTFLHDEDVTIIVSSYNSNNVISFGLHNGGVSGYITKVSRAMGMGYNKGKLYVSNLGQLLCYTNQGETNTRKFGTFTSSYYPQFCYCGGDIDIHDVKVTDAGIFYISTLYNCIAMPSMDKTFELYWKPPWIRSPKDEKMKSEDRCHLNGLCCQDGIPRYVTSASQGNSLGHWRKNVSKGIIYDIWNEEIVCDRLWAPHSPNLYDGKLWILQSGTGEFGYVDLERKKFIPKVFLPGFLRGLTFCSHYAVVCLSMDRHDQAFKDMPLSDNLVAEDETAQCGLRIIDMNDFSVKHEFNFTELSGVTELYDVVCVPGSRARVIDLTDDAVFSTYFPPTPNETKFGNIDKIEEDVDSEIQNLENLQKRNLNKLTNS